MEKNISDLIQKLIIDKSSKGNELEKFVKANEDYQKLIEKGLTHRRGFNLMTKSEIYNPTLNSLYSQPGQVKPCEGFPQK